MGDSAKSQLEAILKSVVSRNSEGPADTMLVSAHLSQMKMFGIRQGVEFYPLQDNLGTQRYDFIQQVIKFNKLDARLDRFGTAFLHTAKVFFIFDRLKRHIAFTGSIKTPIELTIHQKVI